jgi:hypothetical protein
LIAHSGRGMQTANNLLKMAMFSTVKQSRIARTLKTMFHDQPLTYSVRYTRVEPRGRGVEQLTFTLYGDPPFGLRLSARLAPPG